MAKDVISTKRLQIDKANTNTAIFLAVSCFIVAFSLVSCRALLSQREYQGRVIKEKKKALTQLKANNEAAKKLVVSYKAFVSMPDNIIGGNPAGTGDRDGDNARIVLDALPSKYDFPALATSVEKIVTGKSYKLNTIAGTDDELNQSKPPATVAPVEMPFQVSVTGNTDAIQSFIDILEKSIRPIRINKFDLNGNDSSLTIVVSARSYYQPEKTVNITTKVVK